MTWFQSLLVGGLALIGVYLAVRLASAAYFQSKRQYEKEKTHG